MTILPPAKSTPGPPPSPTPPPPPPPDALDWVSFQFDDATTAAYYDELWEHHLAAMSIPEQVRKSSRTHLAMAVTGTVIFVGLMAANSMGAITLARHPLPALLIGSITSACWFQFFITRKLLAAATPAHFRDGFVKKFAADRGAYGATISILAEGIASDVEDREGLVRWPAIQQIRSSARGVSFEYWPGDFYFVPATAFADREELEAFAQLARDTQRAAGVMPAPSTPAA